MLKSSVVYSGRVSDKKYPHVYQYIDPAQSRYGGYPQSWPPALVADVSINQCKFAAPANDFFWCDFASLGDYVYSSFRTLDESRPILVSASNNCCFVVICLCKLRLSISSHDRRSRTQPLRAAARIPFLHLRRNRK